MTLVVVIISSHAIKCFELIWLCKDGSFNGTQGLSHEGFLQFIKQDTDRNNLLN